MKTDFVMIGRSLMDITRRSKPAAEFVWMATKKVARFAFAMSPVLLEAVLTKLGSIAQWESLLVSCIAQLSVLYVSWYLGTKSKSKKE